MTCQVAKEPSLIGPEQVSTFQDPIGDPSENGQEPAPSPWSHRVRVLCAVGRNISSLPPETLFFFFRANYRCRCLIFPSFLRQDTGIEDNNVSLAAFLLR
nr:hypothetical protein Iba_chr07cCG13550 [Ipomoea batatas]